MSDKTDPPGGTNHPQLDLLELWLNYENKMDELRSRFLTIASILFAVQFGVFTLMLDKVLLSEGEPLLTVLGGWLLVVLSLVIAVFLLKTYCHYNFHIKSNFYRSRYIVENPRVADLTIKCLKKELRAYLKKPPRDNPQPLNAPGWVVALSIVLLLFIWLMFGLGYSLNPHLQKISRSAAPMGNCPGHKF